MNNIIFALVFISPPFLKKIILAWLCGAQFGKKAYVGWFSAISARNLILGDYAEIKSFTLIRCGGDFEIGDYSVISNFNIIYGRAGYKMGRHSYLGPQSIVNVEEYVIIGNFTGLGFRTLIFTHLSFLPYTKGYHVSFGRVTIGNNSLIATGVFIQPNIEIGDNVYVNSRSVVRTSIKSGQIVEGHPAKPVGSIKGFRRKMNNVLLAERGKRMLAHFKERILEEKLGLVCEKATTKKLTFQFKRKIYCVLLITSNDDMLGTLSYTEKTIFLLANNNLNPVSMQVRRAVIDLVEPKVFKTNDPIFEELKRFFSRYYGLKFEYI